jgi:cyclophilin family peptidyl-prolyl cis-trans isomerase
MAEGQTAVIETEKGTIRAQLYTEGAPLTTENFIGLARKGFYDGLTFHRVVPNFVIQGGCPEGTGTGGSGKKIKLEVSPELKHTEGALAMARSQHPDSASSQFYITLAPQSYLDMQYAVFGQVTEGMDVVKEIRQGDKMTKVTIE